MKRPIFLFCGLCWLAFGVVTALFLWGYLAGGGGLQDSTVNNTFFNPVSSASVFMGLVHAAGFFVLTIFCFLVGMCLCLLGIEPRDAGDTKPPALGQA